MSYRGKGNFSFNYKYDDVPKRNQMGYSKLERDPSSLYQNAEVNKPKRGYFDEDGDSSNVNNHNPEINEDEEDTLDQFMVDIQSQVSKQIFTSAPKVEKKTDQKKGVRVDIDEEDAEESYYRYMEENPEAGVENQETEREVEYDEDGNPIIVRNRVIDPLSSIDHSKIDYEPFNKMFYQEHPDIQALSKNEVSMLQDKLDIKVTGNFPPKPVASFAHFGFDEKLMSVIRKMEYTQPTPIQAQSIPAALLGRDVIGIAKTGSGKTGAYLWPLLVHIMDQRELKKGEGPIGLILAPTRELALQIYSECRKFGKVFDIKCLCAYGGGNKYEQGKAFSQGAEIAVATPGRLIDMIKMKATNLTRVTYLVLDEADRMFDLGFEAQVRSIANHVRPTRQAFLFSATFKRKIEKLASDILSNPVRIVQGSVGEANVDITQIIEFKSDYNDKLKWLLSQLVQFSLNGSVLIFATRKSDAEKLAYDLQKNDFKCLLLHGDMHQIERNETITKFKKRDISVMVATDVAARGLDIPSVKTVVNFDVARDIDTHTHRIGRTGRAGEKGDAYTLIMKTDFIFAGDLVHNLQHAKQHVPEELVKLASYSSKFRKSEEKTNKGKHNYGLGYSEKGSTGSKRGLPSTLSKFVCASSESEGAMSNRLDTMKSHYKTQFKMSFCSATTSDAPIQAPPPPNPVTTSAETPQVKPPLQSILKRKSRWDG